MLRVLLLFITAFLLASCAVIVPLWPVNDAGVKESDSKLLPMYFLKSGKGHGCIRISMPDGEQLKGEFSLVRGGSIEFGSLIRLLSWSPDGRPAAMAFAFGENGTYMQCEFFHDTYNWVGVCKRSTGALYRVEFLPMGAEALL